MNINQLKYLVSVFETNSITNASRERNVSVQAVSKAISDLEKEFGERLFDRTNQGVKPTPCGREIYHMAARIVDEFESLEAYASGYSKKRQQEPFRLALCSPAFANNDKLRSGLVAFMKTAARLNVEFEIFNPRECFEKLKDGQIDAVATIGAFRQPGYSCKTVGTLPTAIVVKSNHPLANKQFVTLADLEPYPASESETWDSFNESIFTLYKKRGLIKKTQTIDNDAADNTEFMHEDNGYFFTAFIPAIGNYQEETTTIPIDPNEQLAVPICLVSQGKIADPALRKIENILLDAISQTTKQA